MCVKGGGRKASGTGMGSAPQVEHKVSVSGTHHCQGTPSTTLHRTLNPPHPHPQEERKELLKKLRRAEREKADGEGEEGSDEEEGKAEHEEEEEDGGWRGRVLPLSCLCSMGGNVASHRPSKLEQLTAVHEPLVAGDASCVALFDRGQVDAAAASHVGPCQPSCFRN